MTAGGLVFVASWPDRTIHAYDKENGKLLWEKEIEANPEGLPSVYEIDGREYIVFCASGRSPDSARMRKWPRHWICPKKRLAN